jgi:hypothetical protein
MTFKTKTKAHFQLFLRRLGLLCKKPTEPTKRVRISKTINPDGSTTKHERLTQQPLYGGNTFETELHVWNEIHKNKFKKSRKSKK